MSAAMLQDDGSCSADILYVGVGRIWKQMN